MIARRGLLRTIRTPQTLIASLTSPVLFLVLFRVVFAGAIHIPGISYTDYIVPAMLVQNIVFGGFQVATVIALDYKDGILDRLRALPSPRSAALTGRSLSDLATRSLAHTVALAAGFAVGFRLHNTPGACLLSIPLLALIGTSLFWIFAAMGLATRNPETVQSLTPPFFLLLFVSSAFIPVDTLPHWLRGFAGNQPISIFTDALRALSQGHPAEQALGHSTVYFVIATVAWCAAITTIFAPLALRLYRRA